MFVRQNGSPVRIRGLYSLAILGFSLLIPANVPVNADPLIETDPIRTIDFPEYEIVSDFALSSNGSRAYAVVLTNAVNITALAVYYWPESLVVIGALWTLFALAWIRKRTRHPQLVGQKCCPSCGYCIEGCPTQRCPECGNPRAAARFVIGRTRRRRAVGLLTSILAYWTVYAGMHLFHLPRTWQGIARYEYYSTALARWQAQGGLKLPGQFINSITEVIAVDVERGKVIDHLLTRSGKVFGFWVYADSIALDGNVLLLSFCGLHHGELLALDVRNGDVIRSCSCVREKDHEYGLDHFLGFDPTGRSAYYVFRDHRNWRVSVGAWTFYDEIRTTRSTILERECGVEKYGDGLSYYCADFIHIPGEQLRFLETTREISEQRSMDVSVVDATAPDAPVCFRKALCYEVAPLVDSAGTFVYLAERFAERAPEMGGDCLPVEPHRVTAISKWDLSTLGCELVFEPLPFQRRSLRLAYNECADCLIVSNFDYFPPDVYVGDCQTGEWIQRLKCPSDCPIQRIAAARDVRRVVIQVKAFSQVLNRTVQKFLIYEVDRNRR